MLANLFKNIPVTLPDETFNTLAASDNVRIERIVSRGHASPPGFWHDQPRHEWVLLVQGEAVLRFENGERTVRMLPGDHLDIRAGERHRVDSTAADGDTIWLAVFYD